MAPPMATSAPAAPEPASAPSSPWPAPWPLSQRRRLRDRTHRSRAECAFASVGRSRAADWKTDERNGGCERSEHSGRRSRRETTTAGRITRSRERTHRSRASINRAPLSGRTSDQDTLFVLAAREEDSGPRARCASEHKGALAVLAVPGHRFAPSDACGASLPARRDETPPPKLWCRQAGPRRQRLINPCFEAVGTADCLGSEGIWRGRRCQRRSGCFLLRVL